MCGFEIMGIGQFVSWDTFQTNVWDLLGPFLPFLKKSKKNKKAFVSPGKQSLPETMSTQIDVAKWGH